MTELCDPYGSSGRLRLRRMQPPPWMCSGDGGEQPHGRVGVVHRPEVDPSHRLSNLHLRSRDGRVATPPHASVRRRDPHGRKVERRHRRGTVDPTLCRTARRRARMAAQEGDVPRGDGRGRRPHARGECSRRKSHRSVRLARVSVRGERLWWWGRRMVLPARLDVDPRGAASQDTKRCRRSPDNGHDRRKEAPSAQERLDLLGGSSLVRERAHRAWVARGRSVPRVHAPERLGGSRTRVRVSRHEASHLEGLCDELRAEVVALRRLPWPQDGARHRPHAKGLPLLSLRVGEHRSLGTLGAAQLKVLEVRTASGALTQLDAHLPPHAGIVGRRRRGVVGVWSGCGRSVVGVWSDVRAG